MVIVIKLDDDVIPKSRKPNTDLPPFRADLAKYQGCSNGRGRRVGIEVKINIGIEDSEKYLPQDFRGYASNGIDD